MIESKRRNPWSERNRSTESEKDKEMFDSVETLGYQDFDILGDSGEIQKGEIAEIHYDTREVTLNIHQKEGPDIKKKVDMKDLLSWQNAD